MKLLSLEHYDNVMYIFISAAHFCIGYGYDEGLNNDGIYDNMGDNV